MGEIWLPTTKIFKLEPAADPPPDSDSGLIYYLRRLMKKQKEIVMSGIRPTGFLHLGNYFGAVAKLCKDAGGI